MSTRRKDPKDAAIEFVMTQPLEAAAMFVSTLGSIVKARSNGVQLAVPKPATQRPAAAARTRTAKQEGKTDKPAEVRPIRAVAPAELEESTTTGSGGEPAQPDKTGDGLPLN